MKKLPCKQWVETGKCDRGDSCWYGHKGFATKAMAAKQSSKAKAKAKAKGTPPTRKAAVALGHPEPDDNSINIENM